MLSGIKQQGIVGKDGKIEIQTSELAEGTVVEVIVLVDPSSDTQPDNFQRLLVKTDYG